MHTHAHTQLCRNPHSPTYAPYTYVHPYILDWTIEKLPILDFFWPMKELFHTMYFQSMCSPTSTCRHIPIPKCTFSFAQHESQNTPLNKNDVGWLYNIPASLTHHISGSELDIGLSQHPLWTGMPCLPKAQKPRAVNERTPGTKPPGHFNQPISLSSRMNPRSMCRGSGMWAKRLKPAQKARHGLGSKECNAVPQLLRSHCVPRSWAELHFPKFVYLKI